MTSWDDLPFEIKSQILILSIEAALTSTRISYWNPSPSLLHESVADVIRLLDVAPELRIEAEALVEFMIEKRLYQYCSIADEMEANDEIIMASDDDTAERLAARKGRDLMSRLEAFTKEIMILTCLEEQLDRLYGSTREVRYHKILEFG